jgi:hypothetical protein
MTGDPDFDAWLSSLSPGARREFEREHGRATSNHMRSSPKVAACNGTPVDVSTADDPRSSPTPAEISGASADASIAAAVPRPRPSPSNSARDEEAESAFADVLIAEHKAGRLKPVEVVLPNVPDDAPPALVAIVRDFELVMGLRLAAAGEPEVIYGCEWAGERVGLHKVVVARWLRRLVAPGALDHVGSMPPRGKGREGTRPYLPSGYPHVPE